MRNKITTAFLAIALMSATMAYGTPEQDRLWATRVTCELQTAGAQSLPTLTFSQGSTPLISLDQFRAGKSVNADSNIVARLVFGPTQTNQYYVAVTNYAVTGNGYLIQCPSVGTNTVSSGAWWYTAYFESDTGKRYWTGNGRLNIVSTTSTEDGLTWQEFVRSDSVTPEQLAAELLGYEPVLPSTPTNPASKYLNGNREWTAVSLGHTQLSDINGDVNYQHITTGQVAKLDYISDSGVLRVHDSAQPSRYFMEVVNSTGTVFEVTGPFTNLMVTLSDDFEETVTHTRPAWTTNVFPFTDGAWTGTLAVEGGMSITTSESVGSSWISASYLIPATLIPGESSQGTATVSVSSIYYTTNAIKHLATEAELEAAKAACGVVLTNTVNGVVSNLTADIAYATNALMPYARTVYGDLATTNEAGYAAFNATNAAAASYSAIIPTSFIGSNTNTFRYRFNSLRKFGAVTNTAWFVKSGFGAGLKSVSTLVSVKDASGNVMSQSSSQPVYLSDSSSLSLSVTNVFTMPDNVYSGTVEVACIAVSTNASFSVRLYSGAQYTNLLTFSEAPTPYATYAELGTRGATNVTANGVSGMYDEPTRTLDISAIVPSGIVTNGMNGFTTLTTSASYTGAEVREASANNGSIRMGVFNGGSYSLAGLWANTTNTSSAYAAFAQDSSGSLYFSSPVGNGSAYLYFGFAGSYWPMYLAPSKLTMAVPIDGTSVSLSAFLRLTPTADPPASASEGMVYADTDHHLYYYDGSTWKQLDN